MVFSMAAEIKRGLISAWTKEALRARRASGLPVGQDVPMLGVVSGFDPFTGNLRFC